MAGAAAPDGAAGTIMVTMAVRTIGQAGRIWARVPASVPAHGPAAAVTAAVAAVTAAAVAIMAAVDTAATAKG